MRYLHCQTVERHAAAVIVRRRDEQVATLQRALRLWIEDVRLEDAHVSSGATWRMVGCVPR
jgi:hypothetical protein